ncbi:Dolichyl-phosphate-mannose-protein mannosyltransferase [uncultured archaeon]|nr:Dolichyl-phosphate-mannose-protein mannosyltransferase [uncultured archaeon]
MIKTLTSKINNLIASNQTLLLVFFSSMFILITFAGTRLFFSDEGVILNQFYNLMNGSLALKFAKINVTNGVFIAVGNSLYGKFSYSLLILSLPVYYVLKSIDSVYGAHLFLLQLWALSGGFIAYLIAKNRKDAAISGILTYFVLIAVNLYSFKPIYFPKWGEVLSIEFTNIIITSFIILLVYLLFKSLFNNKIAIFASFFVLLATPVSFYALTLKHHNLAIFLTLLAFLLFHRYSEKKDNRFMYAAYLSAGLCVWTRVLDGAVLLVSLLVMDLIIFRRSAKYIVTISLIILISLIPFFSFNQLILGDPFKVIEVTPLASTPMAMTNANEFISLDESPAGAQQLALMDRLGYTWNPDISPNWLRVLADVLYLKTGNTFGILLISPFLVLAVIFVIERARNKVSFNTMDKIFGLYFVLLLGAYSLLYILFNINYLISIITDTPVVLEYRYLLAGYIVLLYFALRIDKIRDLIEIKLKKIAGYCVISVPLMLVAFKEVSPAPFLDSYYYASLITSAVLLISALAYLLSADNKRFNALETWIISIIALSLAEASLLLLFYYWVATMTYISPSQNYTILPALENLLKWMYQVVL